MENIFSEIKEVEKNADEILEKANKERENILHKARIGASRIVSEAEGSIKKERGEKIDSCREKLKKAREEKMSEGRAKVEKTAKEASKRIDKAVDFVLKRIEGMM